MPKTITRAYEVYEYKELCEEAKEKVKEWYLKGQEAYIFTDMCKEDLKNLFPNSELEVEYSLSCCQGDGFNIYGTIYLDEVLEKIAEHFTAKELKFFEWAFNRYGSAYKMEANRHYCYCICSRNDFAEDILSDMEYEQMRGIPTATLEKFSKLVGEYLDSLCGDFEKSGYAYFYEVSDEDLREACEANEWTFTADGEFFAA